MNEAVRAKTKWPAVSIAQAHALLTAPGTTFEMEEIDYAGHKTRAWRNGPKTLVDVWQAADLYASRTFIVAGDDRISFDAFRRATWAVAVALGTTGVAKGDRVAIVMRNQPEWIAAFYGAALAGAIVTPLNAWWSPAELTYAIQQSGATFAFFDEDRFGHMGKTIADCAGLSRGFVSGLPEGFALPAGFERLEEIVGTPRRWADLPPAGAPPVDIRPENGATLYYTSGTSGKPKGALANHRAVTTPVLASLLSQARAFIRRGEAPPTPGVDDPQKVYLLAIPMFHVTGCFSVLNVSICIGARLVILRKWNVVDALKLIEKEGATSIGGVPTIAWQVLEHPERDKYDLTSVDSISYGGAPAAPELVRRLAETFPEAQIGSGWGMTETCATFTHHIGEDYFERPDSCGPATPVGEMKIVDAGGRTLRPNTVGELLVRGPHVVEGYWNMPEETAATFVDGWLKTGDLARLDEDGFCTIVDRAKDVIIRGGENIYSVEVEDVLYSHPSVMDAALVPIPHRTLGEEAGAVVTLKPGSQISEDELKAHVAAHLAPFKIPSRVITWREPLPRNANGKIQKKELRSLFLNDAGKV